jgi:uncharacterized protein YdbL (DUF1318 family)
MKTPRLGLLAVFLLSTFALAVAGELENAQQRIASRLAAVSSLKEKGVLGENNRGLVEVRQPEAGADKVAADENSDRGVIYAELAKKTGATAESVGKTRAKQIAANSKPGLWVQDESGQWRKK